ncbi:MAG: pyruvate formate lyase-activating protein, partial [Chloroflexota bacterium]
MQILTVDVGTGTQDIFLYDSRLDLENGFKLVVPSPTMMVRHRLQTATRRKEAVLLTGVIMGGGP